MALLLFFAALALAVATHAVGQPGFLSIDCGLEANYSGYKDIDTGIFYVSDSPYIDTGENHKVAAENQVGGLRPDLTVRSFPTGVRNCYMLPTVAGTKYLVRVIAFYGNYDGKNSSSTLQFDLYLGVNYWNTVHAEIGSEVYEALFLAWASWAPVCLINTGGGTPFMSTLELRPLGDALYPTIMFNQSMSMLYRHNMGSSVSITRYPDDPYDRYWWQMADATWANLSTTLTIQTESMTEVPASVLQTAVTPTRNNTVLSVTTWEDPTANRYIVFLYFTDFQSSMLREFDAYPDVNQMVYNYTPPYLSTGTVYTSWFRADGGRYSISLAATAKSALPPMLNAFEVYFLINHDMPMTFSKDFDAIMTIKLEYGVKKNWMGDPCFPPKFAWDGVKCRNMSGNIMRIISLDLSNSNLHGVISNNFTLLTALENLNLSGNQLNGPIPDSLCKNNGGQFTFSYGFGEDICNKTISPSSTRNRMALLAISVVAPVLLVAVLVLAYLIWRVRRKPNISTYIPLQVPVLKNSPGSITNHLDHLQDTENRQFTYEELKKLTNNFQRLIGRGGFGSVYYGRLENNTEVAVKIRSEYSRQGLHQFLAEVKNLTKVHHRNLVSLVGTCWEKDHLALVYEYMSAGSLSDHLRGKVGVGDTLNWATRLRIVLQAAQGLDYLHKGCKLPIIHRDVKTNNILLDKNLKSKLADFGLSKTYISDMQTHISTDTAAGTPGYIDPEYQLTGKLTESSDVYSFGVVLLEVATGEPPVLPDHDHTHVTQHVKNNITSGNISLVADARLKDSYDVSSMWKVVDTAMLCTANDVSQRPTMSAVVVQLKESLALEEARVERGVETIPAGDAVDHMASKNGPSAR